MINKKVLIIVIQLFVANILVAQNLNESLGGVKTNFKIVSDTVDLKVSDQIIILKAEQKHYGSPTFGYGWGYGYQSFHLEFIAKKDIRIETFKFRTGRDNESKLELIFYNSENNILASTSVPFESVDLLSNPSTVDNSFFYSIDLIDIPIVLLEKTYKIGLTKKEASKD